MMNPEPIAISQYSNPFPQRSMAILYVPAGCKEAYEATDYWKGFKEIIELKEPEPEKCAAPAIAYDRGELVVESETEGAECHVTITTVDAGEQTGGQITLTPTYTITAWATAEGYAESDHVTATLAWSDSGLQAEGMTIVATKDEAADVNQDTVVDVADIATIISVMASKAREQKDKEE